MQNKRENIERWRGLKGRYAGQRAFVVGNGPSLNQTPMHLLSGEYTMCFNRFHLMTERLGWFPSFYAISDDRVAFDIGSEVVEQVLPRVEASFFPDIHPYNVDFRKVFPPRDNLYWLYLDLLDFSDDLPYAGMNKTVANVGMQVLAYLGFNPIYLIGVDMSYSKPKSIVAETSRDWTSTENNDPNHFDPRYFGAGRKYHAPRMAETRARYVRGFEFFSSRGVDIVNAGVGGELDVFPRADFRSLFPEVGPDAESELLREAVATCEARVEGDVYDLPEVDDASSLPADGGWMRGPVENADITTVLRTHLVFGPDHRGRFLGVPRASGAAW